jgi:hypothetical protein
VVHDLGTAAGRQAALIQSRSLLSTLPAERGGVRVVRFRWTAVAGTNDGDSAPRMPAESQLPGRCRPTTGARPMRCSHGALDADGVPWSFLRRHLFHRARIRREVAASQLQTDFVNACPTNSAP